MINPGVPVTNSGRPSCLAMIVVPERTLRIEEREPPAMRTAARDVNMENLTNSEATLLALALIG
ncbi:MAG: hypothetical protein AAF517_25240, partial [Planctomycetota bacterium]